MNHFSGLFAKMKAAIDDFERETQAVQEILQKHCGTINFTPKTEIKDGVLSIQASPAYKQIVFMRKEAIASDLCQRNIKVFDIR